MAEPAQNRSTRAHTTKAKLMLRLFIGLIFSSQLYALDNPDAPNYVDGFYARTLEFEKQSPVENPTNHKSMLYYTQYLLFLDNELNNAYSNVISTLPETSQPQLRASQRNWIKFKEAEFSFIDHYWTRDNFGSSYIISRGDYKASILKSRIIQLLHYLKNS